MKEIKGYTTQDLVNILNPAKPTDDEVKQVRYKMYLRRSTLGKERQEMSIPDQEKECVGIAVRERLQLAGEPIREKMSAKEPDTRPLFREMIDEIKKGKYSGILAWHPDRLARNMKEAGEIIDLLDKGIIKSLRFVSFSFNNDVNGKVMLGIAFVMSKQYSDNLSVNVMRGIKNRVGEGKTLNVTKHGYFRDADTFQHADSDNFAIIRKAWDLRLEGTSLDLIADYLNKTTYKKAYGINGTKRQPVKFTKQNLSDMFTDPFYAGVFQLNENVIDLTQIRPNFKPMVIVDEFLRVNQWYLTDKRLRSRRGTAQADEYEANLMRGRVLCGYCGQPYWSGITPRPTKAEPNRCLFYYRCHTEGCPKFNKSERANVMVTGVHNVLKEIKVVMSKELYDHYKAEMQKVVDTKRKELENVRRALQGARIKAEKDFEEVKALVRDAHKEKRKSLVDAFQEELNKTGALVEEINGKIDQVEKQKSEISDLTVSYEKFLEHFNNMASLLEGKPTMPQLDFVIGKVFTNITLKDEEMVSYQLNSPFREFVEKGFVVFGRGSPT